MVLLNCCGAAAAGVYIDSGAGAGRSRAPGSSSALSASCISEYQRHNTDTQGAVFLQQMVTPTRSDIQTAYQCIFQQVTIAECTTYTKSSWSHHPQWSKVPFFTSHWFKILVTFFKILKNTECSPMVRTAPTFRAAERSPEQPRSCGATELASGELEIVNWKGECRKGQGAGGGVVLAGSIHAVASGHMEPPPTPDTRHS